MKKLNSIMLIVFILLSFAACAKENHQETTTSESQQSTLVDETVYFNVDSQNESDKLKESGVSGSGGGELTLQKYRSIYYSIPSPFWDVVDENSREDIYGEYWEQPYSEINTMRMKIFVEEYNVPREKFDAANAEWARIVKEKLYGTPVINPQDYANQEFDEVYNADIIYTFDDEIINEYYLSHDYPYCYESEFEEAVASGEYTPRTVDWVDIEQMEAEIIAKYGEAEIVTTVAAEEIPTEETTVEEATEAVTDTTDSAVTEA